MLESEGTVHFDLFFVAKKKKKKEAHIPHLPQLKIFAASSAFQPPSPSSALGLGEAHETAGSPPSAHCCISEVAGKLHFGKVIPLLQCLRNDSCATQPRTPTVCTG